MLALVAAGAAIIGHGIVRLATGRSSLRGVADAWLIGAGAVVAGVTPGGPGPLVTASRVCGLVLVVSGTLLMMRDRAPGRSSGR